MLLPTRHVQILPLLCALCHLTLAFPTLTQSAYDDVQSLQVNIPHSGAVFAPLGGSISIPCLASLSSTPTTSSISPVVPRIKWTVVSDGVETQILVARGQRVKVNESYRDRAALLNYTSSPDDLSLWLGDLRSSDSGHYRCEVQQGLEDASDLVQLRVKGVVFHYRDALGRYAFSYHQAQRACEAIGAEIATPDQLLAAYYDGYEQCDAGWLADQSVRYPIQVPREGCYGDMDGQPGVRNYGTMDADDLFDVYCYVEQIDGKVFHDPIPQQLSFDEAQSYCRAAGAELATTAQLYLAWSEGLDRCSPGWLSDGSVRYPIINPRERCGGPQAGVKSLYRFSNQTGFPEPSSLHDVYCFKDSRNTPTDSPVDYVATEPEDIGQDVVILTEADQELQLNQHAEQVEREAQSALESFPIVSSPSTEENLLDTHTTVTLHVTESPLNTTSNLDLLQLFNETSSPAEMSSDSYRSTAQMNSTISSTETYDIPQNMSLLPSVYNETESHQNINFTFRLSELESTAGSPQSTYAPYAHNQTVLDTPDEVHTLPSVNMKETQAIQEANLDLNRLHANYSETDSNHTQEENITRATPVTTGIMLHALEDPVQPSFSTQPPTEGKEKEETSLWLPGDGSGDNSQEIDLDIESANKISTSVSSTSDFSTHPSTSASSSSSTAEPRTVATDQTLSSGSQKSDKLGFNVVSTAQLWESSISRQEGSTNLEADDTVTMEIEEKQLYPTTSEKNLVSGVSSGTSESPERSDTSQLPMDFTTTQYRSSVYREYLDTATAAYEEASGQEPGIDTTTLGEILVGNVTSVPTLEEEFEFSPTLEEEAEVSFSLEKDEVAVPTFAIEEERLTLEEAANVTPPPEEANIDPTLALEEEAKVAPVLEEEVTITPTLEEKANIAPTIEDEANVASVLEEEASIAPTSEEEASIAPTLEEGANVAPILEEQASTPPTHEDEANVAPILEEEASIAPTLEEGANVAPTLEDEARTPPTHEDEANVAPILEEEASTAPTIEDEANVASILEEEASTAPTIEGEANVASILEEEAITARTFEEEASIASVLEEGANVAPIPENEASIPPTHEDEANVAPILEEEASLAPSYEEGASLSPTLEEEPKDVATLEEEASIAPTLTLEDEAVQEDFTVFPLHSFTSNWPLLTTTTGPQESLNDLEYSRKPPPITTTTSPDSSRSAVSNTATTKTTTTHLARRIWSPTTSATRVFHKTTEPQKVTHLIPPVDQGLVDVEFSLTQPPTLLILPNERAAVGGAGKASDACQENSCLNGGTCTDRHGQIQCLCLPTYGGDFCQTDLERCEPGWDRFHGFCYRHFSQRLSWEVAEKHCRVLGAHLVSIMSPEEQSYINNNYKEYQWTGLNDKTIEDDFRWSDGSLLLYENWYRGQPDSYFLSGEDCVVMVWHDDGRWSDVPCNYHLAYTCKKGTSSCGPPPKVRNTSLYGKVRQRYETNAVVRYYCTKGFQQKLNPLIRCLPGGSWERPQILCIPEAGFPTEYPEENSKLAAFEDEFETTKDTPQYWDIKF